MPTRSLNLGILAHVDAGKTTLTERLLHLAGVIDHPGSVDSGTTQTDTLALERRRGITIKAAVVAFPLDDTTVNVVDTPGHPDFIAEVERSLAVLDGAVLVLSAVEGVQPQTRILMRALQRLRVPTLLFVNKIDRTGADLDAVLRAIRTRLTPDVLPMGAATGPARGRRRSRRTDPRTAPSASGRPVVLAEHDDALLAAYVEGRDRTVGLLRAESAAQTAAAVLHPVYAGSAATGAGVPELMAGIADLLPGPDPAAPEASRPGGSSRWSGARPGRRSPTSGCSPARSARASGSTCRRGGSARSPGPAVRGRAVGPCRRGRCRPDRSPARADRRPGRRRVRRLLPEPTTTTSHHPPSRRR